MDKLCNMCGNSCKLDDQFNDNYGAIDITITGGYPSTPGNGSGALDDMNQYTFSLCEFCLDFIFSNFVIPPVVKNYHANDPHNFRPALERVINDSWRRFKEKFFINKMKRDLNRKIIKKDS